VDTPQLIFLYFQFEMTREFKQCWWTIPSISTKRTIAYRINSINKKI